MVQLLIILAQIVTTGGVLYLAYRLLFDGKADYRFCRLYLVCLPVVSLLLPLLDIPIYPAEEVWIASEAELPLAQELLGNDLLWRIITYAIYVAGSCVILAFGIRQLFIIGRIRHSAKRHTHKEYTLYRTPLRILPFALFRSIYISRKSNLNLEPMILTHEESHIRRGHTFERPISEIWKVLLWWSPFTWLAALKLVEVQEEEADHDVLQAGFKPKEYMRSIFIQMFGFEPSVANSYTAKFTKRRFKAIAAGKERSRMWVKKGLLIPLVALLMTLFSFSSLPTEYHILANEDLDQSEELIATLQENICLGCEFFSPEHTCYPNEEREEAEPTLPTQSAPCRALTLLRYVGALMCQFWQMIRFFI